MTQAQRLRHKAALGTAGAAMEAALVEAEHAEIALKLWTGRKRGQGKSAGGQLSPME